MSPQHAASDPLTVGDVLHATPLGPILDLKVDDVMKGLGLGQLPSIPPLPPMPGFPALPELDLSVLIRPVLDLLASFGSGNIGQGGFNPLDGLQGIGEILGTTMSMGSQALAAADRLWSGTSYTATAAKSVVAGADSAALTAQGSAMRIQTTEAAAIVAEGLALLHGVVAKFVAIAAAAAPTLMTPPGQAVVLAVAADGLAEASAVVAATRAQLLAPTSQIAATGTPVPVTNAPVPGPSPFQVAGELLQTVGVPLVSGMSKALSEIGESGSRLLQAQQAAATAGAAVSDSVPTGGAALGTQVPTAASSGIGAGGAAAGVAAAARGAGGASGAATGRPIPLAPFAAASGTPGARGEPGVTQASAEVGKAASSGVRSTVSTAGSAMAPVGAMGAMGAAQAGRSAQAHSPAEYLVSDSATEDLLGVMPTVVPPVLGQPEPQEQPDVVLRLGKPS